MTVTAQQAWVNHLNIWLTLPAQASWYVIAMSWLSFVRCSWVKFLSRYKHVFWLLDPDLGAVAHSTQSKIKMEIKDVILCLAFFFELYHSVCNQGRDKLEEWNTKIKSSSLNRLPIWLSSQGLGCYRGRIWWKQNNISSLMQSALQWPLHYIR